MANSAWLGLQKKDSFKVSCMRLYQTRERLKQASTAVLQVWDGLVWTASKDHWGMGGCGGMGMGSLGSLDTPKIACNIVAVLFPISTLLHLPSRNLSFPRFSIIFSSCSSVFPLFSAVFSPSPGPQDHPIFTELGGGAWQVLPGLRASMWRVLADPAPGGHGVGISEITFYRCLGRKWGGLGAWRGSGGSGGWGDGGDGNGEMICLIHVDTESGSSMLWSFVQQLEGGTKGVGWMCGGCLEMGASGMRMGTGIAGLGRLLVENNRKMIQRWGGKGGGGWVTVRVEE